MIYCNWTPPGFSTTVFPKLQLSTVCLTFLSRRTFQDVSFWKLVRERLCVFLNTSLYRKALKCKNYLLLNKLWDLHLWVLKIYTQSIAHISNEKFVLVDHIIHICNTFETKFSPYPQWYMKSAKLIKTLNFNYLDVSVTVLFDAQNLLYVPKTSLFPVILGTLYISTLLLKLPENNKERKHYLNISQKTGNNHLN